MNTKIFKIQKKVFFQILFVFLLLIGFFTGTGWSETYQFVTKWGILDSQVNSPGGIAIDGWGNSYVVDNGNFRILKFSPDATFITKWGSYGTGDGQFNSLLSGIAVDVQAMSLFRIFLIIVSKNSALMLFLLLNGVPRGLVMAN